MKICKKCQSAEPSSFSFNQREHSNSWFCLAARKARTDPQTGVVIYFDHKLCTEFNIDGCCGMYSEVTNWFVRLWRWCTW